MKASELYLENRAEGTDNTLTTDEAKRYGDYRALEAMSELYRNRNVDDLIAKMMAEDKITKKYYEK